jgi:hypothetical protein
MSRGNDGQDNNGLRCSFTTYSCVCVMVVVVVGGGG